MTMTFAEISGLSVVRRPSGAVVLTRKFIEGMSLYADQWQGPVVAVMHPVDQPTANLDNVEVQPSELPFQVKCLNYKSRELRDFLATCGFVHWGPHYMLHDVADELLRAGVPSVYCTEYSFRTRRQIVAAEVSNPIRRLRRMVWEWQEERRIRENVPKVTGLEANGTPTYEAYGQLSSHRSLFFDTRMPLDLMATDDQLDRRLHDLQSADRPLRLVFSGRLNHMKGALDLIAVAEELRRRGVSFQLSICGGGPSEDEMRRRIQAGGLASHVFMKGVLPFAEGLVPFVRSEADVFLCCHKQGDPSCTYLETFGCGVPIAGYLNEAFDGLLRRVDAGWGAPMNEPGALADLVVQLSNNRPAIAPKARRALAFARDNSMEATFKRRMEFFKHCANLGTAGSVQ